MHGFGHSGEHLSALTTSLDCRVDCFASVYEAHFALDSLMGDYTCIDCLVKSNEIFMVSVKPLNLVDSFHLAFLSSDYLLVSFDVLIARVKLFKVFVVILLLLNKVITALYGFFSPLVSSSTVFRANRYYCNFFWQYRDFTSLPATVDKTISKVL